jgi:hypothetical protein
VRTGRRLSGLFDGDPGMINEESPQVGWVSCKNHGSAGVNGVRCDNGIDATRHPPHVDRHLR